MTSEDSDGRAASCPTEPIGGEFAVENPNRDTPLAQSFTGHLTSVSSEQRFLASGREAIRAWLRSQAAAGRSTLVAPAYLCAAVLEGALGTGISWVVELVDVGENLEPNPSALVELTSAQPERTCVLAIPLFGWPWSNELLMAVDAATNAGAAVGWDITHALFSPWSAQLAGPRFASLRKWCGIADGGVLLDGGAGIEVETAIHGEDEYVRLRLEGLTAKRSWLDGTGGSEDSFLGSLAAAERVLQQRTKTVQMSKVSQVALSGVNTGFLTRSRRENASVLLEGLGNLSAIKVPRPDLPPDVVPLGIPILVDRRDELRASLRNRGVYCPVHWPLPHAEAETGFPGAASLSRRELTLPCDQRYKPRDMEHIVELVRAWESRNLRDN